MRDFLQAVLSCAETMSVPQRYSKGFCYFEWIPIIVVGPPAGFNHPLQLQKPCTCAALGAHRMAGHCLMKLASPCSHSCQSERCQSCGSMTNASLPSSSQWACGPLLWAASNLGHAESVAAECACVQAYAEMGPAERRALHEQGAADQAARAVDAAAFLWRGGELSSGDAVQLTRLLSMTARWSAPAPGFCCLCGATPALARCVLHMC